MRRIRIWEICILVFSVISFMGCRSNGKKPTDPVETEMTTASSVQPDEGETCEITSDNIVKYMKDNREEYLKSYDSIKEKELSIEERTYDGGSVYFAVYTPEDTMFSVVYRIRTEEEKLVGLDFVASGEQEYLKFDIISITEGNFVTVYSASNTGNGDLIFINLDTLYGRKEGADPDYSMLAVDAHYEKLPCSGSTYALSKVFTDGILTPEYKDVDGDGNTDVVLSGMMETYQSEEDSDDYVIVLKEEVNQLYLYDKGENTFQLQSSEDLTEKIPLTWNDFMVNNQTLLNDTPYPIITLKDIVDYYEEVPTIFVKKEEEGQYWHYYAYEGITFVFLGEKTLKDTDCLSYVVLTDNTYSLINGIQVGMKEEELGKTSLDFVQYTKKQIGSGKSLSTLFLRDKNGLINTLVDQYDTIYYVSGEAETLEQVDGEETGNTEIGLIVVVKDGAVICVATDLPDA